MSTSSFSRLMPVGRCVALPPAVALLAALVTTPLQAQAVDPGTLPGGTTDTAAQDSRHAQGADSTIHPIRGFLPDLDFELIAAGDKTMTEAHFRDKVVMMFFGYASCPDICPTTMAALAAVMENLGKEAEHVRVVFVSVDPHRDTPEILQAYVNAFDSRYAIGLTGSPKQIERLARRYRVAYQIEKPRSDDPNDYEVAHSRGIYIFDGRGKARMLASDGESVEKLTAAVRELLPQHP